MHRRLEHAVTALAVALRHVHRDVRVAEQLLGIRRRGPGTGEADTDAAAWEDLLAVDLDLAFDRAHDPDGGVCTECFNDFGANVVLTNDWKLYSFPWKTMKQLPDWGAPKKPHITPAKLYGIQFQVNIPRSTYDIYIDDLKFFCE